MLMFTGTAIFIFGFVLSGSLYAGYHETQVISDLGVGPTAWLFNTSVFIFGIAVLISAYLLLNIGIQKHFSILIGLAGISASLIGLIPETQGVPHVIAAAMIFLCGGMSALIGYQVFRGPFSIISPVLGGITLIAIVLFASGNYLGLGIGGMERMIAYPLILWILGAGAYLMSPGK